MPSPNSRSRHMPLMSASVPAGLTKAAMRAGGKSLFLVPNGTDHQVIAPAVWLDQVEAVIGP